LDKDTNLQRDAMITRQALEQYMVNKDNQWTLESPTRTLKTGSLSVSTATSMDIWQRNAKQRRRNKRLENASNVTRKNILPKIAKGNKR